MSGRCEWFGHTIHYVSDESLTCWTVGNQGSRAHHTLFERRVANLLDCPATKDLGPIIQCERRVANLLALFEFGRRCRQTDLICRGTYPGHAQESDWKHITHKVCGAYQINLERHVADFRKKISTITQGTFSKPVALKRV